MAAKSKEVKKVTNKKETTKKIAAKSARADKSARKVAVAGLVVPFYSETGEANGTVTLAENIFGQKPNKTLLAQAVRVFLSNQRSAHAKTKRRGEVARTKKKPYKQKGTGYARHGSKSAPIFVGGGIAHGPRGLQNYDLALPGKMRKMALASALSAKAGEGLIAVADIEKSKPKTREFAKVLSNIGLPRPVIVHTGSTDLVRAGRNIKTVSLISAAQLGAYLAIAGGSLIFTKDAVSQIESRFRAREEK